MSNICRTKENVGKITSCNVCKISSLPYGDEVFLIFRRTKFPSTSKVIFFITFFFYSITWKFFCPYNKGGAILKNTQQFIRSTFDINIQMGKELQDN